MSSSTIEPSAAFRAEYPFASRFLRIDGNDVHYIDEGAGPLLLFVHAGPAWSFVYRGVIERLCAEFRCVAIDFPGSGRSRMGASYHPSMRAAAKILEAFVLALDLRDATLVLHDLGGPVALSVASQMPERFVGVAATDSFAWPLRDRHPHIVRMLRLMTSPPLALANDLLNVVGRVETTNYGMGRGLSAAGRTTFLRPYRDRRVRRASIAMLADAVRANDFLAEVDGLARVALAERPVLLVFGEKSPTLHEGFPDAWSRRFPRTRLSIVPGAHHFPMTDDPDAVASAIRTWWQSSVRHQTGVISDRPKPG